MQPSPSEVNPKVTPTIPRTGREGVNFNYPAPYMKKVSAKEEE